MMKDRKQQTYFEDICKTVDVIELREICKEDKPYEEIAQENISGLCSFRQVDMNNRYQGYLKHIQVGNKIGYLIEPGIYYFGEPEGEEQLWKRHLIMDMNQSFEKEVAVIAYATDFHPSFDIAVTYMALDKKNFARLKEIQSTNENSFLHEFAVKKDKRIVSEMWEEECVETEEPKIESEAEEILEGIGFHNIRLGYHKIFENYEHIREYEMAYILRGSLILIEKENKRKGIEWEKTEIDLQMLGELTVRVDV